MNNFLLFKYLKIIDYDVYFIFWGDKFLFYNKYVKFQKQFIYLYRNMED